MAPPRKDGARCTAKSKSTGDRCKNPPIPGGRVCRVHGGAAPQVKAAAATRVLEALVAPALIELRGLLQNPETPAGVRQRCIDSILDRTGYKPAERIGFLTEAQVEEEIERREAELAP